MKKILFILIIGVSPFGINAQVNLDSGLVVGYHFDGSLLDYSQNTYDGVNYGCTFTEDRFGTSNSAINFSSNSYFTIPSAARFQPFTSSTFSIWMKTTQISKFYLIDQRTGSMSPSGYNYGVIMNQSTELAWSAPCYNPDINPTTMLYSFTDYKDGNWHNLIFIKDVDKDTMYFYFDGELKESIYFVDVNYTVQGDLLIGTEYSDTYYFTGLLDELRIYDRAVNPEEVLVLAAVGINENTADDPSLSIHPNPSNGIVNINYNSEGKEFYCKIYNLSGEIVYTKLIDKDNNSSILTDLHIDSPGQYILTITDEIKTISKKICILK